MPRTITSFLILCFSLTSSLSAAGIQGLLEAALRAERWIDSVKIETGEGLAWPMDPKDPQIGTTLYSGTPGIVLFYLELYLATGDPEHLETASRGARYLMANLPTADQQSGAGLYTGVAGTAFVLIETARLTGSDEFWDGARRCVRLLQETAQSDSSGVYWNDSTDIIGGSAGIILFLVYASDRLHDPKLIDLAKSAGYSLIAKGQAADKGVKWAMTADFPRLMPNFSHGTAGNAYALAVLYEQTKEDAFLKSALQGGEYLLSIADTEGGVCLIFHHEPEGEDLYYLGWCHGPVGTARFFYKMHQITGEARWEKAVKESAKGILESGIPEQRTPGFWNNVSQCCGSAGVVEFFMDLFQVYGDAEYRQMAERMAEEVLSKATSEAGGSKWIQAEHRVRPEFLVAQTGYMQGASGIGIMFLHLDAFQRDKKRGIQFPDSPF